MEYNDYFSVTMLSKSARSHSDYSSYYPLKNYLIADKKSVCGIGFAPGKHLLES